MKFFGLFGPPNVKKLLAKKDVKGLIKTLYHNKLNVRKKAEDALVEIGEPAVDQLISMLNKSMNRLLNVINICDEIKNKDDRESYYTKIVEPVTKECRSVMRILGAVGDPRAAETLISVLNKGSEFSLNQITSEAAKALGEIGDVCAVVPLISVLEKPVLHVDLWREAVIALVKIGDARALEPLIGAIRIGYGRRASVPVIRAIADALGEFGGDRAIEKLILLCNCGIFEVRGRAVAALVKIGKPAVEPLISNLQDEKRALYEAALALYRIIMKSAEEIDTDILKRVVQLKTLYRTGLEENSISDITQLAREELIRRKVDT